MTETLICLACIAIILRYLDTLLVAAGIVLTLVVFAIAAGAIFIAICEAFS